jgi:hypothetical protein
LLCIYKNDLFLDCHKISGSTVYDGIIDLELPPFLIHAEIESVPIMFTKEQIHEEAVYERAASSGR